MERGEFRTYRWIVDRARENLSDQNAERYRWRDEELLRFAAQGVEALASVRPASRYLGTRLVRRAYPEIPDDASTAALNQFANSPLLVDPRWHSAIVEFVCHRAYAMDQADSANRELSDRHYRSFLEIASR